MNVINIKASKINISFIYSWVVWIFQASGCIVLLQQQALPVVNGFMNIHVLEIMRRNGIWVSEGTCYRIDLSERHEVTYTPTVVKTQAFAVLSKGKASNPPHTVRLVILLKLCLTIVKGF